MLVDAEFFREERLLTLHDAGRKMAPQRTKVTLWNWHRQGILNQASRPVFLHVVSLPGGFHTSLEEITRFLRAVTAITIGAQCVGGSLHGLVVRIPDSDADLTSEDVADQLDGKVVPASEVYVPSRFIDSRGKTRTFLIHKPDLAQGQAQVIKQLEGE